VAGEAVTKHEMTTLVQFLCSLPISSRLDSSLTWVSIRNLSTGEKNGRIGHHPSAPADQSR
jgi:hypothetical protein